MSGKIIRKLKRVLLRNMYTMGGKKVKKNRVNLENWTVRDNVGDQISVPVVEWMLEKKGLSLNSPARGTVHLLAIGSIVASSLSDATIWGSGIHSPKKVYLTYRWRNKVRYDIRAVRGPLTKCILEESGYDCSKCLYGDPGVLMPYIYNPGHTEKKYEISIINHFKIDDDKTGDKDKIKKNNYHYISIQTVDYRNFIDEILASKRIISSSLHGIILSESYGVPTVFLNEHGRMDEELMKYYDWYFATERRTVCMACTLEEALRMKPMPLPELDKMRKDLINSFPYDLWISQGEEK